jgi:hypothetical protein
MLHVKDLHDFCEQHELPDDLSTMKADTVYVLPGWHVTLCNNELSYLITLSSVRMLQNIQMAMKVRVVAVACCTALHDAQIYMLHDAACTT